MITGSSPRVVRAPPGERQVLHRHEEARFILFLDGEMIERAFGAPQHYRRGDVLFRPAHYGHADFATSNGAAYTHLRASAAAKKRWVALHGWSVGRIHTSDVEDAAPDELLAECRPSQIEEGVVAGVMERAAQLLASPRKPKVSQVAEQFSLSAYDFTRRFVARFGMTPVSYRRQACLQRAFAMLSEGQGTLAEIAIASGFHDQSHMTHLVRAETGLTPGAIFADYLR